MLLLLLLGTVTISESVGQYRSLALHLGACWTQIGFLALQPISYKWKWHSTCLWYFYFLCYIERQNMRKRKWLLLFLTTSPHQLLTPCTLTMVCNRLRHPHCATDLLMRLPVNRVDHFFHVCIQREWCGVHRVKFRTDRQHAVQQLPMWREWKNKAEFRKESMCTTTYTNDTSEI